MRVINHLIAVHGVDRMVLTLRVLTETHPANRSQLNRVVITAVNAICRMQHYTRHGLRFLEAFDTIDLGELHKRAASFGLTMQPVQATLAALISERLRAILPQENDRKPPRPKAIGKPPASITRVAGVVRKVELGRQLLGLRKGVPHLAEFVRARGKIEPDCQRAGDAMRVARAYGTRPEICANLSWSALLVLASPSMPEQVRLELEDMILAGERIGASEIRRARSRF